MKFIYRLNLFAILLASVVIILGAYTRLTDAGLGCPDWPGCYGFLSVPVHADDIATAEQAFPERPVEASKAWNEMIHRYFAGSLGITIGIIFLLCMRQKTNRLLASALLVTVSFQALLGMWTVTMNLMPLVVMGHLLGGFTSFCLLVLLALNIRKQIQISQLQWSPSSHCHKFYKATKITIIILVLQIALGGWTASNYAAVACTQLPICEGNWVNRLDVAHAFSIQTEHENYEFGVLPYESRMTIHVFHRFGAIITLSVVLWLAWLLTKSKSIQLRKFSFALTSLVVFQFALGVSNVMFQLPIVIAVSHNFVALCLLACLISLMFKLSSQDRQQAGFNTWLKE